MLDQLSSPVRGLILDMDGVLWKDDTPIGDLPAIFKRIASRGLQVVLATNNATKTVDEYLAKLCGFGVTLEPRQIVTSSEATAYVLSQKFSPHPRPLSQNWERGEGVRAVFVIGENGIISALHEKGFTPITDPDDKAPVLAVVVGIDRTVTYQKLRRATLHIRAGVPFYGTNPDKTFPTPIGLVPGAGAILAAIEAATDVKPIVIGKPSPFMLELSAERIGLTKDEVLVVGDRLETDIAGGQAMGARTALVLSGVSTYEEAT
ncbi:MAG: HAD-IIA family hydrolase, partial [Chloroflexi bacterium]|nr:HAD-IIA family hydrolase [Chloroflexota bacterium]